MSNPNTLQNPNPQPNLDPAQQQSPEHFAQARDSLAIVYGGIMRRIHEIRMNRAGTLMERMDHKMALYGRIGEIALQDIQKSPSVDSRGRKIKLHDRDPIVRTSDIDHNGRTPKPRTFFERSFDKRLAKIDRKQQLKALDRNRELKNSGALRDGVTKRGILGAKKIATDSQSKKSWIPSMIQRVQANREYRRGNLSAEELRTLKIDIKANPNRKQTFETRMQKETRKSLTRIERKERRMANQRIMQKWRKYRQQVAIGRIKTNHYRAEAQAQRQLEARERKQEREDRRNNPITPPAPSNP